MSILLKIIFYFIIKFKILNKSNVLYLIDFRINFLKKKNIRIYLKAVLYYLINITIQVKQMGDAIKNNYYRIRRANYSDIPDLEKLFLLTRRHAFNWEPASRFKIEDYRKLTEGETVYLAESLMGEIVGFISVWEHDSPAFIHHFFVSPAHQRKGVGKMLIDSLLTWLNLPYRLKCLTKNEKAIAFYLKNNWYALEEGFSEDGDYLLLELSKD